jgi:hypothetical protein
MSQILARSSRWNGESLVKDVAGLKSSIEEMCFNEKFSDVQLLVAGELIPAHKLILAARSPYFE